MKFHRASFLFIICLISAFSAFSQDKSNIDKTPITIKTNLMVLNSNKQLSDVNPEDIKIFEDGVEQKISKLSKKQSLNVGFVIDNSGSLRFQLPAMVGTANLIVENLRENDTAFAVRFVSRDKIQNVKDWTSDKNLLKREINNMYVEGGKSAVIDAIKLSADKLGEKKDESKRSILILISDCEDRDSFYKTADVLKSVKDNDIEVYVIGFMQDLDANIVSSSKSVRQKAKDFAGSLAFESGGMAFFPKWSKKNQDEIIEAARTIIFETRSQYVIEYISSNSNPKIRERKLGVQVADAPNGEKRTAYMRSTINLREN